VPNNPTLPSDAPRRDRITQLTLNEVQDAFAPYGDRYRPILTLTEAAEITHQKPGTLKRLVSEGKFKGCVKRGKPLLFWRDRFVQQVMTFGKLK
jgi:hypothetical protein